MNKLSLVVLALVAVASVHAIPKIATGDMSMQKVMASVKEQMPVSSSGEAEALLKKFSAMLDEIDLDSSDFSADSDAEVGEIGPEFNLKQYVSMMVNAIDESWEKRCVKISGDNDAYAKDEKAQDEFEACFDNWNGAEKFMESYNKTKETGDFKSMFKTVCSVRSGFFECTDKYVNSMSYCYFPSEVNFVHKLDRINKNVLDLFCANEEDNFALFEPEGEGMKCIQQSMVEIKTCTNKAVFKGTERFLAKWIENEYFSYEMDPEDCMAFDEIKSCFVSSVENCTNPKVKDTFASVFQIIRDVSKC